MILIAIVYYKKPDSPFELAKLFSFTVIPSFIVSPIAGAFIDRWDKKRTMVLCDILRGLIVLSIPLFFLKATFSFSIYAAVFLIFAVSCFFLPARLAMIPDLVKKDKLLVANSLFTVTGMIGAVLWFVIGGILVEFLKLEGSLYLNSLIYICSAIAIVFIVRGRTFAGREANSSNTNIEEAVKTSLLTEIKAGFNYLKNHREAMFVFKTLFVLMAGVGAGYAVIIVFIQQAMGSVTRDLGLLGMFLGGGFFLGALFYGKFGHGLPKPKMIYVCLILTGVALFLFTVFLKSSGSFIFASVIAIILGMVIAPVGISTNTLIHEVIYENMRGRVFSSLGIVMNFAFLVFMLIAARLAEYIDRSLILYAISGFYAVFGIIGFSLRKD